jgi:Cdc6-like AAA superfamily ATPase
MRNVRDLSSVLLVFIWKNKYNKKNYIYILLDDMDAIC